MRKMNFQIVAWVSLFSCFLAGITDVNAQSERMTIERLEAGFPSANKSLLKIGRYNPVRVDLKNGSESFSGKVQFLTDDPDGIETRFEVPVQLGPGQVQTVRGLVCPGQSLPRIQVRLVDDSGWERLISKELPLENLQIVDASVRVVGVMGFPSGVEQLPNLPGISSTLKTGIKDLMVLPLNPSELPGRTEALATINAIIIDTSNPETLAKIDEGRSEALKSWILDGGHLVIAVGSQRQSLLDSTLKPILPALPGSSVRTFDLGAIESLVGSRNPIVNTGQFMTVTRFDEIAERGSTIIDTASSSPLIVRGVHGFGRITMLGVDVHDGPFVAWKDRTLFWAKALELKRRSQESEDTLGNNPLTSSSGFYDNQAADLAAALRTAIDQFQGVKVVGFGIVITLILAYLIAIGPGDYLIVRVWLKRPELTWITFPVIVVLVTSTVYLLTYRIKGRDLRVNKIDILDVDYVGKVSRGWSSASIFSPVNADYDAGFSPSGKSREILSGQFPKNPESLIYQTTRWFDSPDEALGGTARPSTLNLSTSTYQFTGFSGTAQIENLRIPIWSTKTLEGRWMINGLAETPVRSSIARTGTDRVIGRITNLLDETMNEVILVYQSQVYDLGNLEPGSSVLVNPTKTQNLTGYLDRYAAGELKVSGQDWAERARVKLPRLVMFHESGSAAIRNLNNGPLSRLDLSPLLSLNRPMLIARINRPASQLTLGGSVSVNDAKVDQVTLIRCLLPLEADQDNASTNFNSQDTSVVLQQSN